MSLSLPDPHQAGVSLPGYRLLERIGQGGSAVVYRAEADDDLARPFAIKLFPPGDDGQVAQDYERELATLRAIDEVRRAAVSKDIVEVVGAGEVNGFGYVVMEYVRGGTLEERLRVNGPLPASEAVALMRPVLRGLALLHGQGLLHKDVKPANVLVGEDGHPRLGDFGLTRSFDAPVSSAGTPGFCAPELYPGVAITGGPRVDVYSAAATLYYLLTGQAPLPGRPDLFLLERHQVDRALQAILFAALAEDPTARTEGVEALEQALGGWAAEGPVSAIPAPLSLGRRAGLLLAVTSALIAVGLGVWLAAGGRSEPPPLWDGRSLQPRGPRVSWTAGEAQVAGSSVQALSTAPVGLGHDPSGDRLAAIGRWGETVALELTGSAPQVLFRIGARSGTGDPPLCAVGIGGEFLARTLSGTSEPDRLEVFDLRAGGVAVLLENIPGASALAVDAPRGRSEPTVYLGTPDGRVVVLSGAGLAARREVRTHADEILALAIVDRRLLVVGDDRALRDAKSLAPDAVVLDGQGVGISSAPRRVLKVFTLPLSDGATPSATLPAGASLRRTALATRAASQAP